MGGKGHHRLDPIEVFETERGDFTGAHTQAGRHQDYGKVAFSSASLRSMLRSKCKTCSAGRARGVRARAYRRGESNADAQSRSRRPRLKR